MLSKALFLYLDQKFKNKNGGSIIVTALGLVCFLLLLIPLVIFNPFGSGTTDGYEDAWDVLNCKDDNRYITQDIRTMESYVDPSSYETISKEEAMLRMNDIYLDVTGMIGKKTCLLKPDQEILEELKKRYTISDEQVTDLLDTLQQVRNGRQYFINPIEQGLQTGEFDPERKQNGMLIKGKENESVHAMLDGTVTEIETSTDSLPYRKDMKKGLTITFQHSVQQGIDEDGEYIMKTMYSHYALMSDIKLSVGDTVKQGDKIGRIAGDTVYIEIQNDSHDPVDPLEYLYMEKQTDTLHLPFEMPIPITSECGPRGLDGYHYGLDMDKGVDTQIHGLANGQVVAVNRTCAPYGGKLGSDCPRLDPVSGGGNYVMIEFEYNKELYYATYMHMADVEVQKGDVVHAGDVIGTQGHSGNSSASHLHLEIHKGSKEIGVKKGLINPKDLLDFD